jgi:hypothetical protein
MLERVADGLWCFEDQVRLPLGIALMARTTVVQLPGDRVLLHAPLRIDDERARAIEAIGEPAVLVAPSCLHFMFLKAAAARWPRAKVLAAPRLARKLGDFRFSPLPRDGACEGAGDTLLVRRIEGFPFLDEHVFHHAATGTLIATDLVFNVRACSSFAARLMLWCAGAYGKVAQGIEWRLLLRDRQAAAESAFDVLAWGADRIVMAHGEIVASGGQQALARALRWIAPSSARALLGQGAGAVLDQTQREKLAQRIEQGPPVKR